MAEVGAHILIVDDDPINVQIIEHHLMDEAYRVDACASGELALEFLAAHGDDVDAVLLDRMMPGIDGMTVLAEMKKQRRLQNIPVIIQSARVQREEIVEGIKAGAFYYLTKPFDGELLLSIVQRAAKDSRQFREVQSLLDETYHSFNLLSSGSFQFQTVKDGVALAGLLSRNYPHPQSVIAGLRELFLNAVEHGNLGITYEEKTQLNTTFSLTEEVERRLALPEYKDLQVVVDLETTDAEIIVTITDEGKGFNWQEFMEVSPERVMDNHGRGIAIANLMSFDSLTYNDCGNQVVAVVKL